MNHATVAGMIISLAIALVGCGDRKSDEIKKIDATVFVTKKDAGFVDFAVAIPLDDWNSGCRKAANFVKISNEAKLITKALSNLQETQYESTTQLRKVRTLQNLNSKALLRFSMGLELLLDGEPSGEIALEPVFEASLKRYRYEERRIKGSKETERSVLCATRWLFNEIQRQSLGSYPSATLIPGTENGLTKIVFPTVIKGQASLEGKISFSLNESTRYLVVVFAKNGAQYRILDTAFAKEIRIDPKSTEGTASLVFMELSTALSASNDGPSSMGNKASAALNELEDKIILYGEIQSLAIQLLRDDKNMASLRSKVSSQERSLSNIERSRIQLSSELKEAELELRSLEKELNKL